MMEERLSATNAGHPNALGVSEVGSYLPKIERTLVFRVYVQRDS